jgi:hypothetical protein
MAAAPDAGCRTARMLYSHRWGTPWARTTRAQHVQKELHPTLLAVQTLTLGRRVLQRARHDATGAHTLRWCLCPAWLPSGDPNVHHPSLHLPWIGRKVLFLQDARTRRKQAAGCLTSGMSHTTCAEQRNFAGKAVAKLTGMQSGYLAVGNASQRKRTDWRPLINPSNGKVPPAVRHAHRHRSAVRIPTCMHASGALVAVSIATVWC